MDLRAWFLSARTSLARKTLLALSVVAICLAVALIPQQPIRNFPHPAYPFVHRCNTNVTWTYDTYGGLARATGEKRHRIVRRITHVADAHGFMNDPDVERPDTPFDIVALGDSFTAYSPIDHGEMWPARLAALTDTRVYNLGHPGEGPWHALMNFEIES